MATKTYIGKPCKRGHGGERLMSGGCVQCGRDAAARRRAENPEAAKAALKAWYEKNKDEAKIKASDWYFQNKDKAAENKRIWNEKNKEKKKRYNERWRLNNPEKVKEISKASREKRKLHYVEMERARCAKRRAIKRGAEGSLSKFDVKEITRRQGGKCAYCKRKTKMTIDHIIPLIQGGRHSKENIQMTCARCNSAKGGRHPIEFAQRIGLLL